MAYVYLHKKNSDDTIFYVGIGDGDDYKRSRCVAGRSDDWKAAVKEGSGFVVQILHDNVSYERALDLEMEVIAELGRKSLGEGQLVNLTAGGQGRKGITHTTETIQKIINSEGYKNRDTSNKRMIGKTYEVLYGEEKAKNIKDKQSKSQKKREHKTGAEHHMFGKKRPEHSAKLKDKPNAKLKGLMVGDRNPMKNPENAKKVSLAKLGIARPKLVCPHCGKQGGSGNMQRWHFDNCSSKVN
jgi:hypothetical protein